MTDTRITLSEGDRNQMAAGQTNEEDRKGPGRIEQLIDHQDPRGMLMPGLNDYPNLEIGNIMANFSIKAKELCDKIGCPDKNSGHGDR